MYHRKDGVIVKENDDLRAGLINLGRSISEGAIGILGAMAPGDDDETTPTQPFPAV
jgi:hypothetical protein